MKTQLIGKIAVILAVLFMSACSSRSKNIDAIYVSSAQYTTFNCDQIAAEMGRISLKVEEISGVQNGHATKDAVALGTGIIFWPALFFMIGDDKKEELSRLKGEYEALEQASIQKNCMKKEN